MSWRRDELTVLAALAEVADERSFSEAALELGVSSSATSPSIRTLEERLGLPSSPARPAASRPRTRESGCSRTCIRRSTTSRPR